MRRLPLTLVVALLAALASLPVPALGQAAQGPLIELAITGSPLVAGEGGKIGATVTLAEPADLRLRVVDFDGRTVKELFEGPRDAGVLAEGWFGRDEAGARVPRGPYRIVATATPTATSTAGGASDRRMERADAWVTVADRAVYPKAPELITIVVDPGHGGDYDGAVARDGTREADLNLDIGLRLARMLEGAGVNVVITRTTDANVNTPPEDRTGDGVIDGDDELAARPDMANAARADLFLSIHNNIAVNTSVGGPSTFFYDERPFAGRNARLARIVQDEMVAALSGAVGGDWKPHDHGALVYPYYVLRGFDPPRLRRPTQMPGVLSEGMFLSNPRELALLKRPAVRAAMAAGYYEAISKYLARRGAHVGYELVDGPVGPVAAGAPLRYRVDVRNQGSETIREWRLKVHAVKAPSRYVGRIRDAATVGETELPILRAGERRTLELEVAAPEPGEWMLLFDARDRDGTRAAELGSPMLQVPLDVAEPVPTTSPDPTASPEARPEPSAAAA
jgi:N-acetylmuramoyl-L-alanine amidase